MTDFTHSLAVVIGIDAYEHGIPPLITAVNAAARLNCSRKSGQLGQEGSLGLGVAYFRQPTGLVRLGVRLSDLRQDAVKLLTTVICAVVHRPALPAPSDDGVNMPGPVMQDAWVNIGSCRPDKCAQIGIHPGLPKQLRIEQRPKERADQDRREVDGALTTISEPHIQDILFDKRAGDDIVQLYLAKLIIHIRLSQLKPSIRMSGASCIVRSQLSSSCS